MTATDDCPRNFAWRAHPAREHRGRALIGVLSIILFAVLAGLLMQSSWWAVAAAFGMLLALNRFFLPSEFVIDDEGLTARYPLRRQTIKWPELRRFVCGTHAGLLCTRARQSWLDTFRGVHILFGRKRADVCREIRRHLPEGGGAWAS